MLAARWQVRLLGGLELRCGDMVLTRLSSRSVASLLARLALRPHQRHSREQLTELIWPDVSPDVGRNRFRTALAMLRRVLEPPGWTGGAVLTADRLTVQWNPSTISCDAVEFEQLAHERMSGAARQRYGGELLPGFYDDWIVEERARLQSVFEALDAGTPMPANAAVFAAPPPRQAQARADDLGLPASTGTFFGRLREAADLAGALATHRLVTLTGPGGAGKTRLAVESARLASDQARVARVAFVALAECTSAPEIVERVRAALQLPDNGARDDEKVLDQVAADLDDAPALLVLDNYEQLVEEGGVRVVERLLERLPRLRLLVTSRRALRLPDECEIALSPLALPDAGASLAEALGNPGVALFVERARDVRRDFQLGARNVADVVQICRVLEGLPLAIELAAAKVRAWSLADMASALATSRSDVLRRTAPARGSHRHASLHAAIAWSWQLLSEEQQRFLMALTVFRGGWTAAAAQAVARLPHPRELIESLVVDSLVQSRPDADGGLHFSMLETVREFAREQLVPAHARELRQRHRDWFLALARDARASHDLVDEVTHVNLLAGIASALDDGEPAQAVQLALPMFKQWMSQGSAPQVRALLGRLAAEVPPETPDAVAFLCALARLLMQAGASAEASRLVERAKALMDDASDPQALADAHYTYARVVWTLRRDGTVEAELQRAMAWAREAGSRFILGMAHQLAGTMALRANDLAAADAAFMQAEACYVAEGDRRGALLTRHGRLRCLVEQREFARAIDAALAGIEEARHLGHVEAELLYLDQLAMAYANTRRDAEALAAYRRQTELARRQHKVYLISFGLWNQARLLARLRQPEAAATLMAFAKRYWELHFSPVQGDDERHVRRVCGLVAAQVGEAACQASWERGLTMTMAEGLALGCHGDPHGAAAA